MKLSVCVFTYNHEKFIAQAIESVLMQKATFKFELLIGEDCSTDKTREVVECYKKRFPEKIKVIYNERNLGMMENNINVISQSRGEYIALLDGDDYWINADKLQTQVDFLEQNTDYSFCFHDGRILMTNGQLDKKRTCCGAKQKKHILFTDVICNTHIPTFSIVFRRSAMIEYPPKWFRSLNAPDRPLFLLLAAEGPGYYFNKIWGVYRKHPNGCWTGRDYQSRWFTHLQIYHVINRHFQDKYRKWFDRCESRITYLLAIDLIKDNKKKRALCCIRKYIRINGGWFHCKFDVYLKIILFLFLYLRIKFNPLIN